MARRFRTSCSASSSRIDLSREKRRRTRFATYRISGVTSIADSCASLSMARAYYGMCINVFLEKIGDNGTGRMSRTLGTNLTGAS